MDYSKEGKTSVKVHHGPGGKSNFSLAWDAEPSHPIKSKQVQKPVSQPISQNYNVPKKSQNVPVDVPVNDPVANMTGKASVKIHNPPGGRSNIQFG